MSSAGRLIDVMRLYAPQRTSWTPPEAAQALALSRATAYRAFRLLADAGWLELAGDHRYALGPRLVELDRQVRLADPLVQAAVDPMVALARGCGGVALLCRLYQDRVLCVHQERGPRAPGFVSYERGLAMPLDRGATSKVILAQLPAEHRARLVAQHQPVTGRGARPTGSRGNGAAALRAELEAIRTQRLCVSHAEVDPDACGIAVPLFDGARLLGSLSAVLRAADAEGRALDAAMRQVRKAGQRIELALATQRGA